MWSLSLWRKATWLHSLLWRLISFLTSVTEVFIFELPFLNSDFLWLLCTPAAYTFCNTIWGRVGFWKSVSGYYLGTRHHACVLPPLPPWRFWSVRINHLRTRVTNSVFQSIYLELQLSLMWVHLSQWHWMYSCFLHLQITFCTNIAALPKHMWTLWSCWFTVFIVFFCM